MAVFCGMTLVCKLDVHMSKLWGLPNSEEGSAYKNATMHFFSDIAAGSGGVKHVYRIELE